MPRDARRFVLVVEDDVLVISVFRRAFEGQDDYLLDVSENVTEAIAKIHTVVYDIIFVDMKLGGHSRAGMKVLQALNQQEIRLRAQGQPSPNSLPVIMSASVDFRDIMQEAHELGVLCFIDKPIDMDEGFVRRAVQRLGLPLMPRQRPA